MYKYILIFNFKWLFEHLITYARVGFQFRSLYTHYFWSVNIVLFTFFVWLLWLFSFLNWVYSKLNIIHFCCQFSLCYVIASCYIYLHVVFFIHFFVIVEISPFCQYLYSQISVLRPLENKGPGGDSESLLACLRNNSY